MDSTALEPFVSNGYSPDSVRPLPNVARTVIALPMGETYISPIEEPQK